MCLVDTSWTRCVPCHGHGDNVSCRHAHKEVTKFDLEKLTDKRFEQFEKSGVSCRLQEARQVVSSLMGREVTSRSMFRWRKTLRLAKGRGAFYKPDEVVMIARVGILADSGWTYKDAYNLLADLQAQGIIE